jgi:hypothetical protein
LVQLLSCYICSQKCRPKLLHLIRKNFYDIDALLLYAGLYVGMERGVADEVALITDIGLQMTPRDFSHSFNWKELDHYLYDAKKNYKKFPIWLVRPFLTDETVFTFDSERGEVVKAKRKHQSKKYRKEEKEKTNT